MPWLTPTTAPTETTCRRFLIPDDSDFIAAMMGALLSLTYPENWEQSAGGISAEAAASLFLQMYMEAWDNGEDCTVGGIEDVRIEDGILQKKVGGVWLDVSTVDPFDVDADTLAPGSPATASFVDGIITFGIPAGAAGATGPQGATGPTGEQGEPGVDGVDGSTGPQGEPGEDGEDGATGPRGAAGAGAPTFDPSPPADYDQAPNICAASFQTFDYFVDLYSERLAEFKSMLLAELVVADIVASAVNTYTAGVSDWIGMDTLVNIARGLTVASIDGAVANANDSDFRLEAAEGIYCAVKANNNLLTEAIFNDWCEDYLNAGVPIITLGGEFSYVMLNVFTYAAFAKWWKVYIHDTENDCELLEWCPDGDHYIDHFTAGNGDKTFTSGEVGIGTYYGVDGSWVSDSGRTDAGSIASGVVTTEGYTSHRTQCRFVDLGAEYTVIQAAYWIIESSTLAQNRPSGQNIAFFDAAKELVAFGVDESGTAQDTYHKVEWTGSQVGVRYIRFGHDVDIATGAPFAAPTYMDEIEVTWLL